MLNIKCARIDERLIHGQILIKWIKVLGCKRVIVLDDVIIENPITVSVLKMSFPRHIRLDFYDFKSGIKEIKEGEGNESTLILLRNIKVLKEVFDEGIILDNINLCRLPYEDGKEKINENLYISQKEKKDIMGILQQGAKIYIQMVPDSDIIYLKDIL